MSVGVKVTDSLGTPAPGAVEGVVKVKVPATLVPTELVTDPPLKTEAAKVWPNVIAEALGAACNTGVWGGTGTTWMLPVPVISAVLPEL